MTAHEIVIRLGRQFDVQTDHGAFCDNVREITVTFNDRESAEAAQREITVSVRPVNDAGGEDYRPVVTGEVVQTEADVKFAADLAMAVLEERMRAVIVAPKPDLGDLRGDLARDMRDLRELEVNSGA